MFSLHLLDSTAGVHDDSMHETIFWLAPIVIIIDLRNAISFLWSCAVCMHTVYILYTVWIKLTWDLIIIYIIYYYSIAQCRPAQGQNVEIKLTKLYNCESVDSCSERTMEGNQQLAKAALAQCGTGQWNCTAIEPERYPKYKGLLQRRQWKDTEKELDEEIFKNKNLEWVRCKDMSNGGVQCLWSWCIKREHQRPRRPQWPREGEGDLVCFDRSLTVASALFPLKGASIRWERRYQIQTPKTLISANESGDLW